MDCTAAQTPKRVAIIGGGISGLSAAYFLRKFGGAEPREIHLYEAKERMGGNADTVFVNLGQRRGRDTDGKGAPVVRWVDLGVNDFNADQYKLLMQLMAEIGFHEYAALEDTACFYDEHASDVCTDDSHLVHGVSDSRFELPEAVRAQSSRFFEQAGADYAPESTTPAHYWMTVGDYVRSYRDAHLREPQVTDFDIFVERVLLPRISAMYFTNDESPEQMPMVAVMNYYRLQEGHGDRVREPGAPTPRRYFKGGSQAWIDALRSYVERECQVCIKPNFQAQVMVPLDAGPSVYLAAQPGSLGTTRAEKYDAVIIACHADDALRSLNGHPSGELVRLLGQITYTSSVALCHTFAAVMPPSSSTWRTYNIARRRGEGLRPYSISYEVNRHQNDAAEGDATLMDEPKFFVTLNPAQRIPSEFILDVDAPERRLLAGYPPVHRQRDTKARAYFKHNVVDFACLSVQRELPRLQGKQGLYFCGGWTRGAGLHEQCLAQARDVVLGMLGLTRAARDIVAPPQPGTAAHTTLLQLGLPAN